MEISSLAVGGRRSRFIIARSVVAVISSAAIHGLAFPASRKLPPERQPMRKISAQLGLYRSSGLWWACW